MQGARGTIVRKLSSLDACMVNMRARARHRDEILDSFRAQAAGILEEAGEHEQYVAVRLRAILFANVLHDLPWTSGAQAGLVPALRKGPIQRLFHAWMRANGFRGGPCRTE